jgi:hypothetical protein
MARYDEATHLNYAHMTGAETLAGDEEVRGSGRVVVRQHRRFLVCR